MRLGVSLNDADGVRKGSLDFDGTCNKADRVSTAMPSMSQAHAYRDRPSPARPAHAGTQVGAHGDALAAPRPRERAADVGGVVDALAVDREDRRAEQAR